MAWEIALARDLVIGPCECTPRVLTLMVEEMKKEVEEEDGGGIYRKYCHHMMDNKIRRRGRNKRYWTPQEDEVLIQALLDVSHNHKLKRENGFKSEYMNRMEEMLVEKILGCDLKVVPHIESRLKHWYESFCPMAEIYFGFERDSEKKLLQVEKSVYEEWTKSTHKTTKWLYGVSFRHYEMLVEIYGKESAIGVASESFVEAVQNLDDDLIRGSITLDSDEDLDFDVDVEAQIEAQSESMQCASRSRKRKGSPSVKSVKKTKIRLKKNDDVWDWTASLNSASVEISKVFENMNAKLVVMAQVWSSEEGRKKKLENDYNIVLDKVMELELSPSDALEFD
ncbi:hypothetical protein V2J09_004340 [Rumex salicifolius]